MLFFEKIFLTILGGGRWLFCVGVANFDFRPIRSNPKKGSIYPPKKNLTQNFLVYIRPGPEKSGYAVQLYIVHLMYYIVRIVYDLKKNTQEPPRLCVLGV